MTDVSELTDMLDLIAAKIDALIAENKRVREALEWYAENVGNCNKDGDEGNTARNRLAKDVGSIARAALGKE
jgi:hypothetical protein